jgi:hypothetical protein
MVAVELLELAEMGVLTRHFTYEEALFFLLPLCRRSQRLVEAQSTETWAARTATWELQKTLRRVRHEYGGFNGGRELRCMELFVRLLHELHATHVLEFSTSSQREQRCVLGFTSIEIGDELLQFRGRLLQLVEEQAAFADEGLQHFSVRDGGAECCVYELLRAQGLKPELRAQRDMRDVLLRAQQRVAWSTTAGELVAALAARTALAAALAAALEAAFDGGDMLLFHRWRFENTVEHAMLWGELQSGKRSA